LVDLAASAPLRRRCVGRNCHSVEALLDQARALAALNHPNNWAATLRK